MGITAHTGPIISFGQAVFGDSNSQAGPCAWLYGDMILDPRTSFTYQPGQRDGQPTYGWPTVGKVPVIDQVPSTASTTNIVNAATPTAGTALTLVSSSGSGITVGCSIKNGVSGQTVTGLLGIDVNTAISPQPPVTFGTGDVSGTTGPMYYWNPLWAVSRCLILTNNASDVSGTYTVAGYDIYGNPMTQVLTGPNNSTVSTTKAFKYIASITPAGTINSTSVSVGTTDLIGIPLFTTRLPYIDFWWGTPPAFQTAGSATFVAGVTTTASGTTGDVRGTLTLPSSSDGTKRLVMFWSPLPSNMTTAAGLVGVPQF